MSVPMSSTSSTLEHCHPDSMLSDHNKQNSLMSDLYAAGSKGSINCYYSKESPSLPSMSWQTNWAANPQSYNLLSENATRMQHITNPRSIESALSSLHSSSEQLSAGSGAFPHIDITSKASLSLLKNWAGYQNATNCSSYSQLLTSPLNFTPIDTLSHVPQRVNEPSVMQPHEADAIREFSQRLASNVPGAIGDPAGPCLASTLAHGLQSAAQQRGAFPSAWNTMNPIVAGRLVPEQSNMNNSATHDYIAHYPFEPGFAERAARFSSLRSGNYSCFGTSSAMPEQGRSVETSRPSPPLGEISPRRVTDASSSPSRGVANPAPTLSVTFVADYDDVRQRLLNYSRQQMPESCTPNGVYPDQEDIKMNLDRPNYCQNGQKLQQSEAANRLVDEISVDLCGEDVSNMKVGIPLKKRRLENDDKLTINANAGCGTADGKHPKGGEQTGDGNSGKRQKCQTSSKRKEEEGKGRSTSSGETSPNAAGKERCNKATDPPKQDYIHVRARRGQATDSHSLAERVRREKISERMRFLQDLVPGCSKITGKAMMLDEIINYVQSLQHQVEFLSMKLAALSPRLDFNFDSIFMGEVIPPTGSPNEAGTVSEMGNSSATLSYQMLQTSFPMRDSPENFNTPIGNGIPSETSLDRTRNSGPANLVANSSSQVACEWDIQNIRRNDGA